MGSFRTLKLSRTPAVTFMENCMRTFHPVEHIPFHHSISPFQYSYCRLPSGTASILCTGLLHVIVIKSWQVCNYRRGRQMLLSSRAGSFTNKMVGAAGQCRSTSTVQTQDMMGWARKQEFIYMTVVLKEWWHSSWPCICASPMACYT